MDGKLALDERGDSPPKGILLVMCLVHVPLEWSLVAGHSYFVVVKEVFVAFPLPATGSVVK
jgi:hypothetical protein